VSTVLKFAAAALGLALLWWVASQTDLSAVGDAILHIGWGGMAAILGVFAVGFMADIIAWMMMLAHGQVSWLWARRLFPVHMVGEAVNVLLPFGGLGGEPVKVMLLKRRHDIPYRDATASLLLVQSINTLSEVPFVLIGLAVMIHADILPSVVEIAMVASVGILVGFVIFLFVALHLRWLVRLQKHLANSRWGERLNDGLAVVGDIEERLFTFVRHRPAKFVSSFALAFGVWFAGALEIYLIMHLLGMPVGIMDAWLLETCVVLARNASFFIPGHLGTQDAAIMLVARALTGSPETGLALALIRRGRELVWSVAGLILGAWLGVKPSEVSRTPTTAEGRRGSQSPGHR